MARMKVKYKNGVWIVSLKYKIFEKNSNLFKRKKYTQGGSRIRGPNISVFE